MSLVWTPEARKQLIPRAPTGEEPKRKPIGAAWGTLRQGLRQETEIERAFVIGRSDAKPPYVEWMARAEELARSRSMPDFEDADVAAVFALLSNLIVQHALVSVIYAHKRGKAFAFDVALRILGMEVHQRPAYVHARKSAASPDVTWRELLLEEPESVRAECKEIAARHWPTASLAQKTTIAYALFEEEGWATEVCRESLTTASTCPWAPELLYPIVRDPDLAMELVRKRTQSRSVLDLVETFGEASLPMLIEVAKAPQDADARYAAEALAMFDDPAAAKALASLVKYAAARPWVQSYFAEHPDLADVLEPEAAEKTKAGAIAKELLEGARRARGAGTATEAALDSLPAIFSHPPWLSEKRPRRPHVSLALARIDRPMTIAWQPGEKERALAIATRQALRDASTKAVAAHTRTLQRGGQPAFLVFKGQRLPDASTLASWNLGSRPYDTNAADRLHYALAKFGDKAVEGLERFVAGLEWERGDFSILFRVGTPHIAVPVAHLQDNAMYGKFAWQWLRQHRDVAVLGLVPAALGDDPKAERALMRLAADGADILKIAAPYGEEAREALEALLEWDTLYDLPKKIPKLGATWKPETFSRPATKKDGKVLPLAAVEVIGTMLAFSPIDPPYAGISIVQQTCTARSLAEFAWDLARSWEHAGHKARDQWMLESLVHFADAEVIRRMTPGIREELAVDVLENIGDNDFALMELLTILGRASKADDRKLVQRIEGILDRAAIARGIEKDDLEEELAPVKPVEADGTVSLDFGPRKLRVGFDEHLEPFVLDDNGGKARALAPARATDDPERVERAKELWRDLKEDVAILASRRIAGLKRAMRSGRKWSAERFQRVWIDNGLMKHIARGVVWNDGTTAFRVAEDGSFTDSHDVAHALAPGASIGVLHPLRAAKEEIDRWRELFADYEILQPFPQLERIEFRPEKDRGPLPFPVLDTQELMNRARGNGFQQRWVYGKVQLRSELSKGVLAIEIDNDVIEYVLEGNPDIVEVSDVLDELQRVMPSTRR